MESQLNILNHRRGARPSVGYLIFQYQNELTRRHAEPTRLSKTKIHIIDGLVNRTIRHLNHCSVEELQACKRGLVYKEQLRDQLKNHRRRRSMAASSHKNGNKTITTPAVTVSIKPPNTPPKPRSPRASGSATSKLNIIGTEIFV
ncbi:hypothetical protein KR009_002669 [Drosophila setifemur]|nr:hypothetical protein KR009_002669 [Drosophila setifemur]